MLCEMRPTKPCATCNTCNQCATHATAPCPVTRTHYRTHAPTQTRTHYCMHTLLHAHTHVCTARTHPCTPMCLCLHSLTKLNFLVGNKTAFGRLQAKAVPTRNAWWLPQTVIATIQKVRPCVSYVLWHVASVLHVSPSPGTEGPQLEVQEILQSSQGAVVPQDSQGAVVPQDSQGAVVLQDSQGGVANGLGR